MKLKFVTLVSCVLLCVFMSASSVFADEVDIDSRFQQSLKLINMGRPDVAAVELQKLYAETKAPRIRLEFARALMLSGRLQEARDVFVSAYEANPPAPVRASIINYIDMIDHLQGKLILGVSFSRISNPLSQPTSFGFNFGGINFNYKQKSQYKDLYGLTYTVRYEKRFTTGYDVKTYVSYRDMGGKLADMWSGDVSGGSYFQTLPVELRAGVQFQKTETSSYHLPYVELAYRIPISAQLNFVPRVQAGYFDSSSGDGFSGNNYRLSAPFVYMINPAETFSIGPRAEMRDAGFPEQRFRSIGVSFDVSLHYDWVGMDFSIFPKVSEYSGVDPFWGLKRSDRSIFAAVELSSDYIRYQGFLPTINGNCDINHSNIGLFEYNNCSVSLGVKKVF